MNYIKQCEFCKNDFLCKNKYEFIKRRCCSRSCATKNGSPRNKKYSFDDSYFSIIDTEEKAYWLGFIYADGCNTGRQLVIKIKSSDKLHLNKFQKSIKSNHKIRDEKIEYKYKQENKIKYASSLIISGKIICDQLQSLGVTKNKTKTIQYPKLSNNLQKHFIRGYFDGDGWITKIKNKSNKRWAIFGASNNFMISMKNILEKQLQLPVSMWKHSKPNKKGITISMMRNDHINKLYHYLYDDSSIYLDRKREIFNHQI